MGVPKLETPSRQGVFARVLGGVPSLTRGNGGMEMAWQVQIFFKPSQSRTPTSS